MINTLARRSIEELESEIATIHAEQESTHEVLATKRTMMEEIRLRINDMILHGKEEPELGDVEESAESPRGDDSPASGGDVPSIRVEGDSSRTSSPHPSSSTLLNPSAPPFRPYLSSSPAPSPAGGNKGLQLLSSHNLSLRTNPVVSSPLASHASTPVRPHNHDDDGDDGPEDGEDVDDDNRNRNEDGDVEMGEVSDSLRSSNTGRGGHHHHNHHHNPPSSSSGTSGNGTGSSGGPARSPKKRGRDRDREHANKEDLEEGEASDGSSDLSSIPED